MRHTLKLIVEAATIPINENSVILHHSSPRLSFLNTADKLNTNNVSTATPPTFFHIHSFFFKFFHVVLKLLDQLPIHSIFPLKHVPTLSLTHTQHTHTRNAHFSLLSIQLEKCIQVIEYKREIKSRATLRYP